MSAVEQLTDEDRAVNDPAMAVLAQVSEIRAEIRTIDDRRAVLVASLKAIRDGVKGIGRGGARKTSGAPRKPRARKNASE